MYFILIGFFIVMSIVAFSTMGYDKSAAQTRNRRIPERTLWNLALFGGGVGAYLGMILYRHKTKHMSFRIGFTLLAILQVALLIWAAQFLKEWS